MSLVTGGEKLKEDVSTSSAHCGTEAVGLIRKWEESLRLRDDAIFFLKRGQSTAESYYKKKNAESYVRSIT